MKGKNNVVGIYLSILNLMEHNRSGRNSILTIQIMKNSQLKKFKYNPCMKRLVDDINKLIRNGLILKNGMKANVRLVRFKMDNLEKAKGQLISKCPYEMIVSSKIPMKLFPGFLP